MGTVFGDTVVGYFGHMQMYQTLDALMLEGEVEGKEAEED